MCVRVYVYVYVCPTAFACGWLVVHGGAGCSATFLKSAYHWFVNAEERLLTKPCAACFSGTVPQSAQQQLLLGDAGLLQAPALLVRRR